MRFVCHPQAFAEGGFSFSQVAPVAEFEALLGVPTRYLLGVQDSPGADGQEHKKQTVHGLGSYRYDKGV
jgi:hypothetical protein